MKATHLFVSCLSILSIARFAAADAPKVHFGLSPMTTILKTALSPARLDAPEPPRPAPTPTTCSDKPSFPGYSPTPQPTQQQQQ